MAITPQLAAATTSTFVIPFGLMKKESPQLLRDVTVVTELRFVPQLGFVDSPSPELFFEAKIAAAVFVNNEYPMVSVETAGMVDVTIVPILDAVDTKFPALGLESVVSKPEFHGALPCAVPIQ